MAKKLKNIIDDGFNPELVETAFFDGILEIPVIKKPKEIIIPDKVIPYSQINKTKEHNEFVMFYEYDVNFGEILQHPDECFEKIKEFPGMVSLDNSLYVDSPLTAQIANVYRSRAIAHYYQEKGYYVIPNVRWGDERSYTTDFLPEKFAFLGLPKHSIVSIGTYGCTNSSEEKFQLRKGLIAMLDELEPEVVLVYGAMSKSVFEGLYDRTQFVNYPDWTSSKRGGLKDGNK